MNRILLITAISLLVGCIANDTLKPSNSGSLKSAFCEYSIGNLTEPVSPLIHIAPYSEQPTLVPQITPNPPPTQKTIVPIANSRTFFINVVANTEFDSKTWELNLKQAMLEWNDGIGYKVFSSSMFNCNTKIDIVFITRPSENDNSVVGTFTGSKCKDSFIKFSTQVDSSKMRKIALHELGHSIGLKHSIYPNDIMFHSVGTDNLSQNDIELAKEEMKSSCTIGQNNGK